MSGTHTYHDRPQHTRIQKRLVLNQCFRKISTSDVGNIVNYITFGGADLFDVGDLVAVFDVCTHQFNIVSYEEDAEIARLARQCPIATTLSQIDSIKIDIIPTVFFDNSERLRSIRNDGPIVYFLDDTKTFKEQQSSVLLELARAGLLLPNDWLLITSCLTPRVVRQAAFMNRYVERFRLFYGFRGQVDTDFKERNHVDLFVAYVLSELASAGGLAIGMHATLVRKFKYKDSRAGMGLWLFRVDDGIGRHIIDVPFEEFPHAFGKAPEEPTIPNIFD